MFVRRHRRASAERGGAAAKNSSDIAFSRKGADGTCARPTRQAEGGPPCAGNIVSFFETSAIILPGLRPNTFDSLFPLCCPRHRSRSGADAAGAAASFPTEKLQVFGQPCELAHPYVFLASDAASTSFVNGEMLGSGVTGGRGGKLG